MMGSYPDSPEAVALALFREIHEAERKDGRRLNEPPTQRMLDLFAQCLDAVKGQRTTTAYTMN